ncbi:MAG: hypothetical protein ABEJ95_03865 [Candidatus Nanohalobium sp.]
MSEKDFVFAADRHGREDDAEGDIYIGAGDEIYAVEAGEDADTIEEHETGLYGNAEDEEEVAEYAAGELDERFAELSDEYEEVYLGLGNHEDHLLPNGVVQQVAQKYDNLNVLQDDLVEIEGRNFYFGDSFQQNSQVEQLYDGEISAAEAGYEEDDLEAVGNALDKEAEEVTCSDVDQILEGEIEVEESTSEEDSGSGIREKLEGLPFVGERVFQPLYSLKDKYFGGEEESEGFELPDIEKTEQHEQIDQVVGEYENMLEEKAEKIDEADGEVTLVSHGQPQTEEMPYASIETGELLERTDNIGAAYVGHFHGGFDGEMEKEIAGVPVINPMEGYTVDESGGALEEYETYGFEGGPVANADKVELEQPELSEEERQKAQQIFMEAQQEAENEEEMHQIVQQRMQEEGIGI